MAANLTLTQKWLDKETRRYREKERVYSDADACLTSYRTLRPKTDVYSSSNFESRAGSIGSFVHLEAYDDGRMKSLLCVHGLLPITFRGTPYNIPIACWIPLDYPQEVPIPYVAPTGDMLVRPSPNVDVSGLCRFDYLARWPSKPEVRLSPVRAFHAL